MTSTPYVIQILEGSVVRQTCATGRTCAYTRTFATLGTYTFTSRISLPDGSDVLATSSPGSVEVTEMRVEITTSKNPVTLGEFFQVTASTRSRPGCRPPTAGTCRPSRAS